MCVGSMSFVVLSRRGAFSLTAAVPRDAATIISTSHVASENSYRVSHIPRF